MTVHGLKIKCSVKSCENDSKARGYCFMHYMEKKRAGKLPPRPTTNLLARKGWSAVEACLMLKRRLYRMKDRDKWMAFMLNYLENVETYQGKAARAEVRRQIEMIIFKKKTFVELLEMHKKFGRIKWENILDTVKPLPASRFANEEEKLNEKENEEDAPTADKRAAEPA